MMESLHALGVRDLEYVVTLAKQRSFSQAAATLRVTQPALSTGVKKVEEILGVSLFERNRKRIIVTERGQTVVKEFRSILDQLERTAQLVLEHPEELQGTLNLGSIATLCPYIAPVVMPAVLKNHPRLQLVLHENYTDELLQKLRGGEIDAALLSMPIDESGLEVLPFFEESFVFACFAKHSLAREKSIKRSQLNLEEMILLDEGHCLREQSLDVCRLKKSKRDSRYHAASIETLRAMITSGLGVSILPFLATVDGTAHGKNLKYVPFKDSKVKREIVLAFRTSYPLRSQLEILIGELKTSLAKYAPAIKLK